MKLQQNRQSACAAMKGWWRSAGDREAPARGEDRQQDQSREGEAIEDRDEHGDRPQL